MVTLEIVKFVQGNFIQWDHTIYDIQKDMSTKAQSSNLNEELGTVHYIFSDKTGTLTQNIMEFKKFSVGNYAYGETYPKVNLKNMQVNGITNVNFQDHQFEQHMNDYQSDNHAQIHRYLEVLSVCHTVIAEKSKNSHNSDHLAYNASSPDELALVNAAKYFGYYFKGRDDENNMVVELRGVEDDFGMGSNTKHFQLLTVIEFTSTRKRMTVIVRSQQDSTIRVMCKGADSIVLPLLKAGQNALVQKT